MATVVSVDGKEVGRIKGGEVVFENKDLQEIYDKLLSESPGITTVEHGDAMTAVATRPGYLEKIGLLFELGFEVGDEGGDLAQADNARDAQTTMRSLQDEFINSFLDRYGDSIQALYKQYKADPAKLQKEVERLAREFSLELRSMAATRFSDTYRNGLSAVAASYSVPGALSGADEARIQMLLQQPDLSAALSNFRSDVTAKAFDAFRESLSRPGGFRLSDVRDALQGVKDVAEQHVEVIARTETNRFFQAGRREGYKRAEASQGRKFLYCWAGPNDSRTTPTCERIAHRAGEGVEWEELVRIVREESSKDFPDFTVDPDAPTAHWQCRHFCLRAFPDTKQI